MCAKLGGLIIKVEPMWTIFQYTNNITDTSAKMGSNVIGGHKIHLNMATLMKKKGVYCWLTFVLRCGYCTVSFQSLVLRHLVIAPVRNINKLPK